MPAAPLIAPRLRPLAYGLVALSVVVVAVLGVLVHGAQSNPVDQRIIVWLYLHIRSPRIATNLLNLSEPTLDIGIVGATAVAAALQRAWRIVALVVSGPIVATLITEVVLKPLVSRRPGGVNADLTGLSFPSGHETGLSAVLVVLAVLLLRTAWTTWVKAVLLVALALWAVVAAVGLVRNFLHYPTDTVGAVGVSVATVLTLALLIDRVAPSRAEWRLP